MKYTAPKGASMDKITKAIEQKEQLKKELEANIRYYRKKIGKNRDFIGILKADARDLIKVIDKLIETKNELNALYYKQIGA